MARISGFLPEDISLRIIIIFFIFILSETEAEAEADTDADIDADTDIDADIDTDTDIGLCSSIIRFYAAVLYSRRTRDYSATVSTDALTPTPLCQGPA